MERVTEAPGVAWLLRKGDLELGGGLLNKKMGLSLGKAGLAWWQGLCWGSCGTGTWIWGDVGYCAFSFLSQRWCWLHELRARQGPATESLPEPLGAQITLTLTLCSGRCLGEQCSPACPRELRYPVDFGGCVPKKENQPRWGVSWL